MWVSPQEDEFSTDRFLGETTSKIHATIIPRIQLPHTLRYSPICARHIRPSSGSARNVPSRRPAPVSTEDIYLFEGDLTLRPYTRHSTHFETARGSLHGTELLRVLVAPGDVLNDPVTALQRCLRAGFGDGPQEEAGEELPDLNLLAEAMLKAIASPPGPAMAAIRAAAYVRAATGSRFPAAERLLFTCVDHAFRKQAQPRRMKDDSGDADHLLGRMQADWVLLPSIALTSSGYRAWSPISPRGIRDLLVGLRLGTERALGQVPVLRRWRDNARQAAAAQHGKSHLDDLITLSTLQPILTGRIIADQLGVTDRTARNLMDVGVDAGLFAAITGRRSYRAWASVPMAEHLRMRSGQTARGRGAAARMDEAGPPERDDPSISAEETTANALADLDDAIAEADRILERYGQQER